MTQLECQQKGRLSDKPKNNIDPPMFAGRALNIAFHRLAYTVNKKDGKQIRVGDKIDTCLPR